MDDSTDLQSRIERDGFAFARGVVPLELVEMLRAILGEACESPAAARRGDVPYAIRCVLAQVPVIRDVVSAAPFLPLARAIVGPDARPVMGVFFDKPAGANWPVPWHQDVTVRVREFHPVPGFEARPVDNGIVHLLPPVELSEQMIALRIHLDDAAADHGALRVIPGSHRRGRLSNDELTACVAQGSFACEMQTGDVMLMRPLLVHASSACLRPAHRRVLHIEYAAAELPGGLIWHG